MKFIATVFCALLLICGAAVVAHGAENDPVKQRQDVMEDYEDYLKAIGKMFRGQTEYDASVVKAGAEQMQDHSGSYLLSLFPTASADKDSHAKSLIWEQWDEFSDQANDLQKAAAGLAANADTLESAKAYYREVASSCKTCHRPYKSR
ncbi:c-type cytochrome [Gynuella sunshinyii]|uniref:Cytochrome c556 n=1 Tax=Gynuella sunshinyii YC6258 TaxID=1445510 RepID=A0A0C5VG14_9GAMM|nr:cytochrome c [Gynuella sunshinyii]AJQ92328.1 cytochrome c556 [Gynuella sunshinyii YC6258]